MAIYTARGDILMGGVISFFYDNDCIEQRGSPIVPPATPAVDYSGLAKALVQSIIYEKNQYQDSSFSNPESVTRFLLMDDQMIKLMDYRKINGAIVNSRYEHSDQAWFRKEEVLTDLRVISYSLTCLKQTLLTLAARYSSPEVFIYLLQHPDIDPNVVNDEGDTPLHIATTLGRMNIVAALISDPRTDISKKDANGKSARRLSKILNFAEIEEIIIKAAGEQNKPTF
jgi:hypothetical protein